MILVLAWMGAAHATPQPTGTTGDTGVAATGDTGVTGTTGDTGAPPSLDVDDDGDGFTLAEGDCDDAEPDAHPGLNEVCGDQIDNDCDGLSDGGCDDAVRLATLRGGGGCTGGGGVAGTQGWVFVVPAPFAGLALARWRRRR